MNKYMNGLSEFYKTKDRIRNTQDFTWMVMSM